MKKLIFSFILVLLAIAFVQATTRYVKQGGTGTGSSWADASGNLASMIVASVSGDEVWVAKGTYLATVPFGMKNGVKIYGGFIGTETTLAQRDWYTNETILKGTGSRVITNSYTSSNPLTTSAVLDGFTVSGGNMTSGNGGGIYNNYASPTLANLIIKNNKATASGGGIFNSNSSPVLTNIKIHDNVANNGGGIFNSYSSPVLTNITMTNNVAPIGGGMHNDSSSSPEIYNSIIWDNKTEVTVVGQSITINNIQNNSNSIPKYYNSLIQGSSAGWASFGTDGGNNIDSNPFFTNVAIADYTLKNYSPAINAGNNTYYTNAGGSLAAGLDLASNLRLAGSAIDMGTYENQTAHIIPDMNNILYVNQTATGSGNGSNWANAIPKLYDALAWAQENKTQWTAANPLQIWIAKGEYHPKGGSLALSTFFMINHVKIYGGFTGTEATLSQRNWKVNLTTLKGSNSRVIHNSNTNNSAVLDGFTITGGNTSTGGGGIFNEVASPTLINLIITNNTANGNGGGMYNYYSLPVLTNVMISNNTSGNEGGGIHNDSYSSSVLNNVTVSSNKAANNGGGISSSGSSAPEIYNSIIWGNTKTDGTTVDNITNASNSIPKFYNSLVQGSSAGWTSFGMDGGNNIDANPLFTDATANNYTLQSDSPAKDSGDNSKVPAGITSDLAGSARFVGIVDMGAYEYQILQPVVYIPDDNFKNYLLSVSAINTNGDGEIQVSEAKAVDGEINCSGKSIADLTGIEAFVNLTGLLCNQNQLISLDLSQNTALQTIHCEQNQLTTLIIGDNIVLKNLYCHNNQLTNLNISQNTALMTLYCFQNLLVSLNVNQNTSLTALLCNGNQLTSLDVSQNTALNTLSCYANQLTGLNLKNGNNADLTEMTAANNPNLTCIQVDNIAQANSYSGWLKDVVASYSLNCSAVLSTSEDAQKHKFTIYPNPVIDVLNIESQKNTSVQLFNSLGALISTDKIKKGKNQLMLSHLPSGVYILVSQDQKIKLIKN